MSVERRVITIPYASIGDEVHIGLVGDQKTSLSLVQIRLDDHKPHFQVPDIKSSGIWPFRKKVQIGYKQEKIEVEDVEGGMITTDGTVSYHLSFAEFDEYYLDEVEVDGDNEDDDDDSEESVYRLNLEELIPISTEAQAIGATTFYHWKIAMASSDLVTVASVGRLVTKKVIPDLEDSAGSIIPVPIIINT